LYLAKGRDIFKPNYNGPKVILNFVESEPLLGVTTSHIADVTMLTNLEKIFAALATQASFANETDIEAAEDGSRHELELVGIHDDFVMPRADLKQFVCPKVRWMELVTTPVFSD